MLLENVGLNVGMNVGLYSINVASEFFIFIDRFKKEYALGDPVLDFRNVEEVEEWINMKK